MGFAFRAVMKLVGFLGACVCIACASPSSPKAPGANSVAEPQPSAATSAAPAVVEIPNARQAMPGVTTGGKPSEAHLRQAKELGYRSVISLLPEADTPGEADVVRSLGMNFVSIPIADASALTEENARRLAAAMDAPGAKPLLLHCGTGNRAGALLALKAFYLEAATPAEALDRGTRAVMTSLRPQVEAKMQQAAP
jgi:protein tyrosine phosphatase (PTP) superfamily phosphohydrolase (DUF442 family)